MREVVNVQIGTYANYVGAHFWNLQDEYIATPAQKRELSPAVFFREGNLSTLPYSPRLQIIDLSGAFGSLSLNVGTVLSEPPKNVKDIAWDGPMKALHQERVPLSKYLSHLLKEEQDEMGGMSHLKTTQLPNEQVSERQDSDDDFGLDKGVTYWSDYSKTRFHPRSCFALPGIHFNVGNFDMFDHGTDLVNSNLLDDMYDNLRFFIEDCDSLGGVHITANASDGFSGVSSSYLARIRDELGTSAGMFVLGAVPEVDYSSQKLSKRESFLKCWDNRIAEARLVSQCIDISTQYVPIDAASCCSSAFEFVHPIQHNDYHSAAILGLALDVAFSPLRIPSAQFSTGLLSNKLRYSSNTVLSSLFTQFPQISTSRPGKSIQSIYRHYYPRESVAKLSNRTFPPKLSAPLSRNMRRKIEPKQVLREIVSARGWKNEDFIHASLDEPVTLPVAFPRFFDSRLSRNGQLRPVILGDSKTNTKDNEIEQISCLAGFATSPAHGCALLQNFAHAVSLSTKKSTSRHAVEKSSLQEVSEQLMSLGTDYSNL